MLPVPKENEDNKEVFFHKDKKEDIRSAWGEPLTSSPPPFSLPYSYLVVVLAAPFHQQVAEEGTPLFPQQPSQANPAQWSSFPLLLPLHPSSILPSLQTPPAAAPEQEVPLDKLG